MFSSVSTNYHMVNKLYRTVNNVVRGSQPSLRSYDALILMEMTVLMGIYALTSKCLQVFLF